MSEEAYALELGMRLSSQLVTRFFIREIIFQSNQHLLTIYSDSLANEILSHCEEFRNQSKLAERELRFQILGNNTTNHNKKDSPLAKDRLYDEDSIILYGTNLPDHATKTISKKVIFEYDTSNLTKGLKIRFYQKLFGHDAKTPISKNKNPTKKSKENLRSKETATKNQEKNTQKTESHITYHYPGFIELIGAEKIGKVAIIADSIHQMAVLAFFKSSNVGFKIREVF
jgi:hypothetical protein